MLKAPDLAMADKLWRGLKKKHIVFEEKKKNRKKQCTLSVLKDGAWSGADNA